MALKCVDNLSRPTALSVSAACSRPHRAVPDAAGTIRLRQTITRCLAGLTRPDSGDIWFGNRQVNGNGIFVPPEKRGAGMVFQSYALWPHMTVFENIAYGLHARGENRATIEEKVRRAAGRLGIESYLDRYPAQLSGGQQQRTALARSLVYEPNLLLLDEPLSNLDAKLRQHMLGEFTDMQRRLGVTTIYVTHNQEEALVMSTEVLLLDKGDLLQAAPPRDLYDRPLTRFAAEFMGDANFFEGTLVENGGKALVKIGPDGPVLTAAPDPAVGKDTTVTAMIRPHRVTVSRSAIEGPNTWSATVSKSVFSGSASAIELDFSGQVVRVQANDTFDVGDDLFWPPEHVVLLGNDHEAVGKRAVVIGGSRGIGRAAVEALAGKAPQSSAIIHRSRKHSRSSRASVSGAAKRPQSAPIRARRSRSRLSVPGASPSSAVSTSSSTAPASCACRVFSTTADEW